jgi:AraC-like DNA-binding protein
VSQVILHGGTRRVAYEMSELVTAALGSELVGFEQADWQPYPRHCGKRLSVPAVQMSHTRSGFTEIVQAADGLHAIITDWPAGSSQSTVWVETVPAQYGYLYISLQGDGRLEIEGLGYARRCGACCSITVAPPKSIQVWRTGPRLMRRGVCIAFHARYLRTQYPDMLGHCEGTLGAWLANAETRLRDFEIPLLPVMQGATAALLSTRLEGQFRYAFVRSTVEQLLCLAIAALLDRSPAPGRLSAYDRDKVRNVRKAIDESLAEPPTIETLAKRFGVNRNKLRFGFKEIFGMPIAAYLLEQKMQKAFGLLEQHRPVGDVAVHLGYAHRCNFTTAFKRRFGQTPSKVSRKSRHP